jgi:hypothetical protein
MRVDFTQQIPVPDLLGRRDRNQIIRGGGATLCAQQNLRHG